MPEQEGFHATKRMVVLVDGEEQPWQVRESTSGDHIWTLVLTAPDGQEWVAEAEGLWIAFLELRQQVEALGYRLCCAGARVDAHMRRGQYSSFSGVYILSRRTLVGIRRTAYMFDYAPPSRVGTVAERDQYYKRWLSTPWWHVLKPGRLA